MPPPPAAAAAAATRKTVVVAAGAGVTAPVAGTAIATVSVDAWAGAPVEVEDLTPIVVGVVVGPTAESGTEDEEAPAAVPAVAETVGGIAAAHVAHHAVVIGPAPVRAHPSAAVRVAAAAAAVAGAAAAVAVDRGSVRNQGFPTQSKDRRRTRAEKSLRKPEKNASGRKKKRNG